MKKVIYKLSIVALMLTFGATQANAQFSDGQYTPFSNSAPYAATIADDDLSDFGDDVGGPGAVDNTPITDGYLAIILLAIPYAIYLYRKRKVVSLK
ncbi:MAG: hypothetical protein ACRC6R_08665 [Bacteroidales bacterium]